MAIETKIIKKNGIPYKVTLEVTRINDWNNELVAEKIQNYQLSKDDISKVKFIINKYCKIAYENLKKTDKNDEMYDYWIRKFLSMQKSAPSYDYLDTEACDIPMVVLKFDKVNHDFIIFFQDILCELMNKDKSINYEFETEDYPGIFVLK